VADRQATRNDARAIAWEARYQQRLETTYIELLKMAERTGVWAENVYPISQSGKPPDTPLPWFDVQADTRAVLKAFGSDALRKREETWRPVVQEMISAAQEVMWEDLHPSQVPPQGKSARVTIEELRPKEREAREALGNQVAVELKHHT
jgi:hypothetical protein